MSIEFKCPSCDSTLKMGDEFADTVVRCGGCKATLRVPAATPAPPSDPLVPPPRPRPKPAPRREPRTARRGVAFWVGVAAAVVVVLAGLGYLAFSSLGQARWRTHESAEAGFRAEFPAAPRTTTIDAQGMPVPAVGAKLPLRSEEYLVTFVDLPPHRRNTVPEDQLFADSIDGMRAAEPTMQVLKTTPIEVSGLPAREVVCGGPKGTALVRLVLADTRAYIVVAGAGRGGAENERARRFVESFAVTDARLLAQAADRRDAPRRAAEAERVHKEQIAEAVRQMREREAQAARAVEAERERKEQEREKARLEALAKIERVGSAFRDAKWAGPKIPDPTAMPGLRVYLPFDDADGAPPTVLPAKKSAELPPGTRRGEGVRGGALYLPADSPGLTLAADALPAGVMASPNLTAAAWVRVRVGEVMAFRDTSPKTDTSFGADYQPGAKTLRGPPGFHAAVLGDAEWHHVAVVIRERPEAWSEFTLFFDGVAVATQTWPRQRPGGEAQSLVLGVTGGRDFGPKLGPRTLPAAGIDEFCLFDQALSEKGIRYLAGRDAAPPRDQLFQVPLAPPPIPVAVRYAGRPVPAPAELGGLKAHLAFDESDDGRVKDSVSGAWGGKLNPLSRPTDGARGKAVRLMPAPGQRWELPGLELDPALLRVAANKPFTLSFWVRPPDTGGRSRTTILQAERKDEEPFLGRELWVTINHPSMSATRTGYVEYGMKELGPPNKLGGSMRAGTQAYVRGAWAGWHHVALVRDEKNEIRIVVDGVPSKKTKPDRYPGELNYTAVKLVIGGDAALDVDELCLFDRAFSDADLLKLAGNPDLPPPPPKAAPEVIAPPPPLIPAAELTPGSVPAANDFKGLRFYLACDEIKAKEVRDAVTGKFVGKVGEGTAVVAGVRGKGLRLVHEHKAGDERGAGLTLDGAALKVEAGKPFTLAYWAKKGPTEPANYFVTVVAGFGPAKDAPAVFGHVLTGAGANLVYRDPSPTPARNAYVFSASVRHADGWNHYALVRDAGNRVRWVVNGTPTNADGREYAGEVAFDTFRLAGATVGKVQADLDEFCLFDRALTADELNKLAGK